MRIEPITLGASDYYWIQPISRPRSNKATQINPFNPSGAAANPLKDLLNISLQTTTQPTEIREFSPVFNYLHLMYPNQQLADFAIEVVGVSLSDKNDVKLEKIAGWVQSNIRYLSDEENWGVPEFWAPPVFTLAKGAEDCDGGSLLIMSLALNSGVPQSRLRWYGGFVDAGNGAPSGGHAWVGYQRESDNEWIAVDFSYFPNPHIQTIQPMSEDMKYKDDYFYMTVNEFISTPGTNRVRNPDTYDDMGRLRNNILVGALINSLI